MDFKRTDGVNLEQFYIGGRWVDPAVGAKQIEVVNPSDETVFASVAAGSSTDVERAVNAAREAFDRFSETDLRQRRDLLERLSTIYERRSEEIALAISLEMGAPRVMALRNQVGSGAKHLQRMIETLDCFAFERSKGTTRVVKEPIGVVGMITPWNWPMNQIVCKVAPAIAAGCTMVLKPSEIAPLSAALFAEIVDEAGVPAGVFNLVQGDGPTVGEALARHPDVDMISITGSTRAGIAVAKAAADTVKRVHQELGGKSANIILDDADFGAAVAAGVRECFDNSGQSCNAPTRMLVPHERMDETIEIARGAAEELTVGPADQDGVDLGPVVSQQQFDRIQELIESGIDEGAELVTGGLGRPDGLSRGYFVRPTVFAQVRPEMRIAREEIFGPVLAIIGYRDEAEAIEIANDSPYGLAAYVSTPDIQRARRIARKLRVGAVHLNYPAWDTGAPFGGYKRSGNGREYAEFGLEDFLEIKGIIGYGGEADGR